MSIRSRRQAKRNAFVSSAMNDQMFDLGNQLNDQLKDWRPDLTGAEEAIRQQQQQDADAHNAWRNEEAAIAAAEGRGQWARRQQAIREMQERERIQAQRSPITRTPVGGISSGNNTPPRRGRVVLPDEFGPDSGFQIGDEHLGFDDALARAGLIKINGKNGQTYIVTKKSYDNANGNGGPISGTDIIYKLGSNNRFKKFSPNITSDVNSSLNSQTNRRRTGESTKITNLPKRFKENTVFNSGSNSYDFNQAINAAGLQKIRATDGGTYLVTKGAYDNYKNNNGRLNRSDIMYVLGDNGYYTSKYKQGGKFPVFRNGGIIGLI